MNKYLKNALRVLSVGTFTLLDIACAYGMPISYKYETVKTVNSQDKPISGLKVELVNGEHLTTNSWITREDGMATFRVDTIQFTEVKILDIDSTENGYYKDTIVNIGGSDTLKIVKMQEKKVDYE